MPSIEIRRLSADDVDPVADVHRAAFPESALSQLGESAVRRFYEWQLTGPHDYDALGAWSGDRLTGICFGGVGRGALSGFVQTNWKFLTACVLARPWLLAASEFRERIALGLRSLRMHSGSKSTKKRTKTTGALSKKRSFGILVIAVHPDEQDRGIGRRLMEAAEHAARRRNFIEMHLTVHPKNRRAVTFYETAGWERDAETDWTGRMRKQLA